VSEKQIDQIKILDSRQLPVRVGLIALVIFALAFGWFAVRWQFGNMLAELTSPNDPKVKEIAALAHSFSPRDPMTNWLIASSRRNIFTPEAINATAKSFENVTRLSPNDFRWWVELGRAREQAEEIESAEQAYLRAVEIISLRVNINENRRRAEPRNRADRREKAIWRGDYFIAGGNVQSH